MRVGSRGLAALCALAAIALVAAGCGGGSSGGGGGAGDAHDAIVLKNQLGEPIAQGSSEPYSPRQTCGGSSCHDVDAIANGYHFQQGRTDATGDVVAQADYFGDGRIWLQSNGMYGKW